MLTYTIECSTSRRWPLAAAAALALTLAVAPTSLGQQGPGDAVPGADLPSNADLDAAAGDMAMTQEEVQQLQETLRDLGYFSGPADGRRGPRTREALRDFQMDQGLPSTGSLDTATVTRIGLQASMVGVPNQPPEDVLRRADVEISAASAPDSEAALPEAVAGDPAAVATDPAAVPVDSSLPPPPAETRSRKSGMKDGVEKVGDVVVGAGSATLKGARVGGKAAVDGVSTAGKATAKAGVVSGKAVATGATKTVDGTFYVGKSIKNGTVYVASKTRDLFVGDKGTSREDEQIRQSLLSQYAGDDRLIASEIEVKVAKGHVTLAVPEGARSDMNQASRLARITPGVKTVTTVFTSVQEQAVAEPAPSPTLPAEAPIADPEMTAPPVPAEPSGPEN
jgi:peptidoglycan hydrolase-like protein with peptidoglycan-binding domain